MLLCAVAKGKEHIVTGDLTTLSQPPAGFNSVMGVPGGSLNFPEVVIYDGSAALPRYVIIYTKDSTAKIAR